MRRLVATVIRHRRYLGMLPSHAAQAAGLSRGHWHNIENHVRTPDVQTLERMAGAVGLELELIPDHLRPFMDLDPAEAWEVMCAIQHYRKGRKATPEVVVTAAAKMDRWIRAGRTRRMTTDWRQRHDTERAPRPERR